jgi:hypothetical protein
MKFCNDNNITIKINELNSEYEIILGPIIDRSKLCWLHYNGIIKNDFMDLINICKSHFQFKYLNNINEMNYTTSYKTFKKYLSLEYVKIIPNYVIPLSEDDILNDLTFMKSKIMKHIEIMSEYKQNNDMTNYNFMNNLLYHEQFKMFQMTNNEEYNTYIDVIKTITDKHNNLLNETIQHTNTMNSIINDNIFNNDNDNNNSNSNNSDSDCYSDSDNDSDSDSNSDNDNDTNTDSNTNNNIDNNNENKQIN